MNLDITDFKTNRKNYIEINEKIIIPKDKIDIYKNIE